MRLRKRTIGLAVISIFALFAVGYVAKGRLAGSGGAVAADSTAADSTAAASADTGKASGKGKKDKKDKKDDEKETPPVPVEVATAARREMSAYYVTTATLEPERKVDVLAKVSGEVVAIEAEEGRRVRQGERLCRLDDEETRIALEEARINRDQSKREMDRLKSMHERDLVSDKEYGDVLYQYELGQNAYESALLKHEYTQIRAPFDGVVTERLVDVGQHVAVGTRIYVVADTDPLRVYMYLPEDEVRRIARGQIVHISPDVDPDAAFTGVIERISPEVDQRTGTVKVTAQTHGGGLPGSFVRVRIVTDTRPAALAVPRRSVVADAGDHFVYIAAADTVRKVEVGVGYEDEAFAEIVRGLAEGD
ncbi:MAG: efflux RND transporter periplasmic adaptor subunit, partial [Candidatus Krumholzibacteria bacterium]|nr:efflux RND transporter periplasmic adaptor subunit [Candidatus Krumholzibacteria bacterium]